MISTRFDGWTRRHSIIVLLALLGLTLFSVFAPHKAVQVANSDKGDVTAASTDSKLYRGVIAGVARGENYYSVAAREHRAGGFPLKPFFVVRPPTLAWFSATLGPQMTHFAMISLFAAALLSWIARLRGALPDKITAYVGIALFGFFSIPLLLAVGLLFHENWAAIFIVLSLGVWRPGHFWLSVVAGFCACLFREMALAFLFLMFAAAILDKRWREAMIWGLAICAAALLLGLHAQAVAHVVTAQDLASPGWNGLGGWAFYTSAVQNVSPLITAPAWVVRLLLPLSLFGWAAWKSDTALRVFGMLGGFALMIMLFARPNNFYWALICLPLLFTGLAFVKPGLTRLVANIRSA
jgi:hypothetical protein